MIYRNTTKSLVHAPTEILNIKIDYKPGERLSLSQDKYLTEKGELYRVDDANVEEIPLPAGFKMITNDIVKQLAL